MSSLESMIESLVADDPRRSADRLLSTLCGLTGASGGAILVPSGDNASVLLSCRLSVGGLGSLQTRFQDNRTRLMKTELISAEGFALAHLGGESERSRGWVYLENPGKVEPRDIRPLVLGIAKAVAAANVATAGASTANRADSNRANILRILEANDWNIARVSRELGVTRRTLYMRLAAFGIERKKVPRLAKPLTV